MTHILPILPIFDLLSPTKPLFCIGYFRLYLFEASLLTEIGLIRPILYMLYLFVFYEFFVCFFGFLKARKQKKTKKLKK